MGIEESGLQEEAFGEEDSFNPVHFIAPPQLIAEPNSNLPDQYEAMTDLPPARKLHLKALAFEWLKWKYPPDQHPKLWWSDLIMGIQISTLIGNLWGTHYKGQAFARSDFERNLKELCLSNSDRWGR